jgi:hypothetical protein
VAAQQRRPRIRGCARRRSCPRRSRGGRALRRGDSCWSPRVRRCRGSPRGRSTPASCVPAGWPGGSARRWGSSVERLAGRKPARSASHPDRCAVATGGLLDQQDSENFGGIPALRLRGREDLRGHVANVAGLQVRAGCR